MNKPNISVIIPVYNAASYLRRCLDSLLAQTFNDFDVILVDDGSTDASLAISHEYAQRDSRIRVYHKENGGVSSARQFGLEQLLHDGGTYCIHLDPDDWVEPQMLEHLYLKALETGAEMVICDFFINTEQCQYRSCQNPKSQEPNKVLGMLFQKLHGSLCNKLILSACYKNYGIHFPEGLNYCEDYLVNVALLLHIHRVVYLPEALYHYDHFSNQQSMTRNVDCKRINMNHTEVVRRCRQMLPVERKNWQFRRFEVNNAFAIIMFGDMPDNEFRKFFSDIPITLLLHPHRRYIISFLVYFSIHKFFSQRTARSIYCSYMKLRHFATCIK